MPKVIRNASVWVFDVYSKAKGTSGDAVDRDQGQHRIRPFTIRSSQNAQNKDLEIMAAGIKRFCPAIAKRDHLCLTNLNLVHTLGQFH